MRTEPRFLANELVTSLHSYPIETGMHEFADLIIQATKFDLGEAAHVNSMLQASHREFFRIPAPVSLFQISWPGAAIVLLLAYEVTFDDNSTSNVWYLFTKSPESQYKWAMFKYLCAIDVDTGEVRYRGLRDNEPEACGEEELWNLGIIKNVAYAIEVFSCTNVFTVEHAPSKFINAKRIAKGKVPLFTYRTLHIRDDHDKRIDRWNKTSHESPRLHLRRGHIRKNQNGTRFWVRAHLVGDKSKGFTHNDYVVHPPH